MIKLIAATQNDIKLVLEILEESERWLARNDIQQWPLQWHRQRQIDLKLWAETGCLYLATMNDSVVGTVAVLEEDRKYWSDVEESALYFKKLAIRREHSGQGVGQSIIKCIEGLARSKNRRKVRLSCLRSNSKLNQYYQRLGYECVGMIEVDGFVDNLYEVAVVGDP